MSGNGYTGIGITEDALIYGNLFLSGGIYARSIRYRTSYFTTSQNLTSESTYANTFNGIVITATLPEITSNNVGIQFLITNTNHTNLKVITSNNQLIYSFTGTVSPEPIKNLDVVSHIFTAIQTTGPNVYGWSMV
jgi:hypothetical protein